MKRRLILPIMTLAISGIAANGQSHVSTEPTLRAVLLEEFTGINCGNCPDGHLRAHQLSVANPEIFFTAAIHAGHYAQDAIDFIVPQGKEIHDYFFAGLSGQWYPSGMVSRLTTDIPGEEGAVLNRGVWGRVGWNRHLETSPVNLWAESSYDSATRKLTINTEAYFTEDLEGASINIYLIQNDIVARQGGAIGNYHHMHMLRDVITDTWGDAMETNKKGETFAKTYEYTLPQKIGEFAVEPADIELLIFVTDKDRIVANVTDSYPTLNGITTPNRVNFEPWVLPIGNIWGFNYFEGVIDNRSGEPVTSATFSIMSGSVERDIEWTGEVAAHSAARIMIPLPEDMRIAPKQTGTTFRATLLKANGKDLEGNDKETVRATVRGANYWPTEMSVAIRTDNDNSQNTWRLLDSDGNVVKEFGPFPQGSVTEFTDYLYLEDDKNYCFEVYDCVGNGVKNPRGEVIFRNGAGNLVGQMKEINEYGTRQFFHTQASLNEGDLSVALMDSAAESISYRNGIVSTQEGKQIVVYTANGTKAAEGTGSVDISNLCKGIYVAVSGGATMKISL